MGISRQVARHRLGNVQQVIQTKCLRDLELSLHNLERMISLPRVGSTRLAQSRLFLWHARIVRGRCANAQADFPAKLCGTRELCPLERLPAQRSEEHTRPRLWCSASRGTGFPARRRKIPRGDACAPQSVGVLARIAVHRSVRDAPWSNQPSTVKTPSPQTTTHQGGVGDKNRALFAARSETTVVVMDTTPSQEPKLSASERET